MIRRPRPNLVELFVVAAVGLCIWSLLANRHRTNQDRAFFESRIRGFRQRQSPSLPPAVARLVSNDDISGEWERADGRVVSKLTLRPTGVKDRKTYDAHFETQDCTKVYSVDRSARSVGGMIVLSEPIAEANGEVYKDLYCIRFGRSRALLPTTSAADEEKLLKTIKLEDGSAAPIAFKTLAFLKANE